MLSNVVIRRAATIGLAAVAALAACAHERAHGDVQLVAGPDDDVPDLAALAAPGKVTLFEFFADWCEPCHALEEHLDALTAARPDVAVRRLDVTRDGRLARRWMRDAEGLPYVIVFGPDRRPSRRVAGYAPDAIDAAIASARAGADPAAGRTSDGPRAQGLGGGGGAGASAGLANAASSTLAP